MALRAQPALPHLKLVPNEVRLDEVPEAKEGGAWLRRLVVGVDSGDDDASDGDVGAVVRVRLLARVGDVGDVRAFACGARVRGRGRVVLVAPVAARCSAAGNSSASQARSTGRKPDVF